VQPGNDCSDHGASGSYRSDHVAYPVDEVQEGTFRLGAGLSLDRNVQLRLLSKVLRPDDLASKDERDGEHGECPLTLLAHFQLHVWDPLSGSPLLPAFETRGEK